MNGLPLYCGRRWALLLAAAVAAAACGPGHSGEETASVSAAAPGSCADPETPGLQVSVYSDGTNNCFGVDGWGTYDPAQTAVVHSGTSAVSFVPANWSGFYFYRGGLRTSYSGLELWVHGGSTGGQKAVLLVETGNKTVVWTRLETALGEALPAGEWRRISVTFAQPTLSSDLRISIESATGSQQAAIYVDDVRLVTTTAGSCAAGTPAGTPCVDANLCNGEEYCDGDGHCLQGVAPQTNDGNPCTLDTCDAAIGVQHQPHPAGTSCTYESTCSAVGSCDGAGSCQTGMTATDLRVYADNLEACFLDWSEAVYDTGHLVTVHNGYRAVSYEPDNWRRLDFHRNNLSGSYDAVEFWVNGGATGGQQVWLTVNNQGTAVINSKVSDLLGQPIAAATWQRVLVSFPVSLVTGSFDIGFEAHTSLDQSAVFIDDLRLVVSQTPGPCDGAPAGTSCSDDNLCNGEEVCDGLGTCLAGTAPVLDDGNACTADSCDPIQGVLHAPVVASTSCSDSNACNGLETCDGAGVCTAGVAPVLDDGNACTTDACDPAQGVTHTPLAVGTACSDGNACNGLETCNGSGTCLAGTAPVLDDGNPCTTDGCDPVQGVTHTPVATGTACLDDNLCNGNESCNGSGTCLAGTAPVIDDGDACTADSCIPSTGVVHSPIPGCASALTLDVSAPPQGFSVSTDLVLVRGVVSGGVPPLALLVNGTATALAPDGTFSTAADVPLGSSSITITVTDAAGATVQQVATGQSGASGGSSGYGNAIIGNVFTYDAIGNLTGVINTVSDVSNCGGLGIQCRNTPHGTAACIQGGCAITHDGQVVNVGSDPANCGDVGNVCADIANATTVCSNGICGNNCFEGYIPTGGRCIDLTSDPTNCGEVGNVCVGDQAACVRGVCGMAGDLVVYSVQGVSPPGQVFKAPLWTGIHIVGTGMVKVTYVELEDWGNDSDGSGDTPSVPTSNYWVIPANDRTQPIAFVATSTTLDIPAVSLQYLADQYELHWRRWYKIRLHYLDNGSDNFVLVDVPVSLDDQAPVNLGPPEITGVSAFRELVTTGLYEPTTGFIPTLDDLTKLEPAPFAVMGYSALQVEYPIHRITSAGVYIRAGLSASDIHPFKLDRELAATFVFPYTNSGNDEIHLRYYYSGGAFLGGVILRGNNLAGDGMVRLVDTEGNTQPGEPQAFFSGDRVVVRELPDASELSAAVEYDSDRGAAITPWPLKWISVPSIWGIEELSGYMQYDRSLTMTGRWFSRLTEVSFSSVTDSARLSRTTTLPLSASSFSYYVVDDKHILVFVPSQGPMGPLRLGPMLATFCGWDGSGTTAEPYPGTRWFTVGNSEGFGFILSVDVFAPDQQPVYGPLLNCPPPADDPYELPKTNSDGTITIVLLPPQQGQDCTNTICLPQ